MDRSASIDRVLVGACALIWLAVIGMSVAAIVALVDLGSGHASDQSASSQTPWALYVVIAISAVIIIASIPLLLRARRAAVQEPPQKPNLAGPAAPRPPRPARPAVEAPTEKLRVFGSVASPVTQGRPGIRQRFGEELIEKVWQRYLVSMANAVGGATLAVALATYCMGTHSGGWAVAALVVAGIITVGMPAIFWRHLRQLPV
jgi:NhaP-type Na+/H+ or K+/H+ antiporter